MNVNMTNHQKNFIMEDEDIAQIFDSEEDPRLIAEAFEAAFFSQTDVEEDCEHEKVEKWADGRGYCTSCGVTFLNASDVKSVITNCTHEHIRKDESGATCTQCGRVLDALDFSQEWRYYGASDNRSGRDPSRCHRPRNNPKGVRSVFESHQINVSPAMASIVEAKYSKVLETTGSKVLRGQGRESIIANCLFHAYQENGEYRTSIYIRNMFSLKQKNMSLGATKYYVAFPEDRVKHITPEKLLPWIMKLTGVDHSHYRRILAITRYISASSELVERSNPQSVAAAIVFFYLCINPEYKAQLGITKSVFSKKAQLSDITVTKIVREIAEISREGITM